MIAAMRPGRLLIVLMMLAGPAAAQAACPALTAPHALDGLVVRPARGVAPLAVSISWLRVPDDVVRIELDLDGDGTVDVVQERGRIGHGARHTYAAPGRHEVVAWVHEARGRASRVSRTVEVLAPAELDRELQARWRTFKDRLRSGDYTGALDCVLARARRRYEAIFHDLDDSLRRDVDAILPDIHPDTHLPGAAIYWGIRRGAAFELRFLEDVDGVWRLDDM